jgi:SpoVK/Ycf46/Vps4 family AAA+-type ATPase
MRIEIQNEAIRLARVLKHAEVVPHHVLLAWVTIATTLDFDGPEFIRVNCRERMRTLVAEGIVKSATSNDLGISERGRYWIGRIDDPQPEVSVRELAAELSISTDEIDSRQQDRTSKAGDKKDKAQSGAESSERSRKTRDDSPITLESALAELDELVGLSAVKEKIRMLANHAGMNAARKAAGLPEVEVAMNLAFTGNPGTGKTTVARIVAKIYKALGILESGHLIETSESGLVAGFVGQTVERTQAIIMQSLGGVLFIDEAYSLVQKQAGGFGQQVITTLVSEMENRRSQFAVIVAGYTAPMLDFLKSNQGLKSRFTEVIDFPDYTPSEVFEVFKLFAAQNKVTISAEVADAVLRHLRANPTGGSNGNGRYARKLFLRMYERMSDRAMEDGVIEEHEMTQFELSDVPAHMETNATPPTLEEVWQELDRLVGLESAKDRVQDLIVHARANSVLEANGLPTVDYSLNLIFTGSPGTGKTTMARIIARAYQAIGVLSRGHIVEVGRADLVAEYVGQTAIKTRDKIDEAMGGVLFIDEAYSLADANPMHQFGREALDTLVMEMENRRGHIAVIAAGYEDQMKDFLDVNPGLKSRFGTVMHFADYGETDLLTIFEGMATAKLIRLSDKTVGALKKHFTRNETGGNAGNGRYVRLLFEKSYSNLLRRTAKDQTPENLTKLMPEDVPDYLSDEDKKVMTGFQPNPVASQP